MEVRWPMPTAAADTRITTAPISARIDAADAAMLRAIAERTHSTPSRLVRALVREGLPALDDPDAAREGS
jgi:hypothetical protein